MESLDSTYFKMMNLLENLKQAGVFWHVLAIIIPHQIAFCWALGRAGLEYSCTRMLHPENRSVVSMD